MSLRDLTLHSRSRLFAQNFSKKLPQGLIIEGPVGSGVVTVAKAIAEETDSLVFVILPKKRQKGELVVDTDEGSIVIEDIRRLYEQTRTKQPKDYVYIIDTGLKSMTKSAQNAFLKLLEEPRAGVHFIIATHRYDKLLPTITSRCQSLPLLPITDSQSNELLAKLQIDDSIKRTRLAFVGRGLPALIYRLASDDELYDARVKIMTDAKTMLGSNDYLKLVTIQSYKDNRADVLELLDDMNHQLQIVINHQSEPRLARAIERNLEARSRIEAGGNIRLQLTSCVL